MASVPVSSASASPDTPATASHQAATVPLGSIQCLRAYSAVAVMIGHTLYEADATFGLQRTHFFPWVAGVHVFFVISGFIMAYTNANAFGSVAGAKRFAVRRLQRIVPLYWVFTTLVLVTLLAGTQLRSTTLEWTNAFASYLFWPDARPDGKVVPLLSVGWTLNYEMFFYALFGLFLLFRRLTALMGLTIVMVGLTVANPFIPAGWVQLKFWSHPIILEFVAGVWLGYAYIHYGKRFANLKLALAGLALGSVLLVASRLFDLYVFEAPREFVWGIPAAILVASAAFLVPAGAERRVPAFALLLGNSSYALYLSHRFPLRLVTEAGQRLGFNDPTLYTVITVVACLAVGIIVYLWIEKPLLRYLQHRKKAVVEVAP